MVGICVKALFVCLGGILAELRSANECICNALFRKASFFEDVLSACCNGAYVKMNGAQEINEAYLKSQTVPQLKTAYANLRLSGRKDDMIAAILRFEANLARLPVNTEPLTALEASEIQPSSGCCGTHAWTCCSARTRSTCGQTRSG